MPLYEQGLIENKKWLDDSIKENTNTNSKSHQCRH